MFEDLFAHWPFLVTAFIFVVCGQLTKGLVFTREAIKRHMPGFRGHLLWWGRKTIALHPVLVGGLLGFIPGMPIPADVAQTKATAVLYFAGAGIFSTFGFSVIKGLLKNRGIELDDAVISVPPDQDSARPGRG